MKTLYDRLGGDATIWAAVNRMYDKIMADPELWPFFEGLDMVAQTTKQVFMQKIREAERDVLYDDFEARVGSLVHGTVQRFEGDTMVVNLGRTEGYLPREERVRGVLAVDVPVAEVEDAGVLEETPDDGGNPDGLAEPGDARPERADPPDLKVDLHSGL